MRNRSCYRPCCCQWLQARLQLSRASVSLEVGRDSADRCWFRLIATASIVDSVGETCALFNDAVFLENINPCHQNATLTWTSWTSWTSFVRVRISQSRRAGFQTPDTRRMSKARRDDLVSSLDTATQIYAPTYQRIQMKTNIRFNAVTIS